MKNGKMIFAFCNCWWRMCACIFYTEPPPSTSLCVLLLGRRKEGRGGMQKGGFHNRNFSSPFLYSSKKYLMLHPPPPFPAKTKAAKNNNTTRQGRKGGRDEIHSGISRTAQDRPTQISAEARRRHKKAAGRNTSFPTDRSEGEGGSSRKGRKWWGKQIVYFVLAEGRRRWGIFPSWFYGCCFAVFLLGGERETSVSGEKNRRVYISSNA